MHHFRMRGHGSLTIVTAIGLAVAGSATRFYLLGDWSFDGDEFFTLSGAEERAWRLLNPLFYQFYLVSTGLFGVSEFSARVPSALFGALGPVAIYLSFVRSFGHSRALLAALIVMFHGWHLWHSQYARYYSAVVLFSGIAFGAYWQAVSRDSLKWLGLFCVAAAAAFFVHITSSVIVAACAAHAVVALFWPSLAPGISRRVAWVIVGGVLAVGLLASPMILGILLGWTATGQNWGYGPFMQALQLSKYFEVQLLVAGFAGAVWLSLRREALGPFLVICLGLPLAAGVFCAAFMAFRPDYLIGILPMAGLAAAALIFPAAADRGEFRALRRWLWAGTLIVVQLPAFVSHYTERLSIDMRDVSSVIEENRRVSDHLISFVNGIDYYLGRPMTRHPAPADPFDESPDWSAEMGRLVSGAERTWILLPLRRAGLAAGLEEWLTSQASLRWRKSSQRFDYTVHGYQLFFYEESSEN